MTMSKHTPAPWEARIDQIGIDIIQSKSCFGITQIGNYDELRKADYPIETAEANAKLIAAAPELLEALEFLLKAAIHCDPFFETRWSIAADKAKAAIKKATE